MELTYTQQQTYQVICDVNGYVGACYIITNTNIYGDKVYLTSTNSQTQIPLDKMKKIISGLKE